MIENRSEKLFEAIGAAKPEYIEAIGKKRSVDYKKLLPLAACFIIVAAVVVTVILTNINEGRLIGTVTSGGDLINTSDIRSSDKYNNLEELLAYLGRNEIHSGDSRDNTRKAESYNSTQGAVRSDSSAVYGGYCYLACGEYVQISKLDSAETENLGRIEEGCDELLIFGDVLVIVRSQVSNPLFSSEAPKMYVKLYSLTIPNAPELLTDMSLSGVSEGYIIQDETLYILHGDGVCACGWSRVKDTSEYRDEICVNGNSFTVRDDNTSILGEPKRVEYTAVTSISKDGDYLDTHSIYGNIEDIFACDGMLIFSVNESKYTENNKLPPMKNHNKIHAKEITLLCKLAIDEKLFSDTGIKADAGETSNTSVVSVKAAGDMLHIIGVRSVISDENGAEQAVKSQIYVLSVNLSNSEYRCAYSAESSEIIDINELAESGDAMVVSWSVVNRGSWDYDNYLSLLKFNGDKVEFGEGTVKADYISGVEGVYSYGRPYGSVQTIIPLDGGMFARYSGKGNKLQKIELYSIKNGEIEFVTDTCSLPETKMYNLESFALSENEFIVSAIGDFTTVDSQTVFEESMSKILYYCSLNGESIECKEACEAAWDIEETKLVVYGGEAYLVSDGALEHIAPN